MFFRKKSSYVDLETQAAGKATKVANAALAHDGTSVPFSLTDRVEVDKITIARKGKEIMVMLGTDDGHFINIDIKEK